MADESKNRIQVTVVEDTDIVAQLDTIAKGEGLQRADILRRAIRRYLISLPINSSEVINTQEKFTTEPTPAKLITPIFETIGKRRRLIGFDASYNGEVIGRYDTERDAEKALDAWVYEELAA
jgi:hypothetical protein